MRSLLINYQQILSIIIWSLSHEYGLTEGADGSECSLFLAESSIPNSGFGVYTTSDYIKGDTVSHDVSIALADVMRNLGPKGDYIHWTHDDYNWRGDWENEYILAEKVSMNAFPLGALTNFHTWLNCVSPTAHVYDDSLLNRNNNDAGVGAYSYYQRTFTATRDIKAGEELFSNYGENWLDSHHFDSVPRKKNFRRAHRILEQLSKNNIHDLNYIETLATIVSWYDKRTASLLPESGDNIEDEVAVDIDGLAKSTIERRTVEWIKENGKCLDNIYGDKSTIPQAGRGAFARRFIKSGDLIVPMPLLQIMNKTNSTLFDTILNDQKEKVRNTDKVIGHHLLLNYCFDHPESSILLCPSTHGGLINHDAKNPNALYKWADWDPNTKEWLQMSFDEMNKRKDKGLAFDIIALRDIQPNEEIFIDYGPLWEEAWLKHVQTFKPAGDAFQSTYKMNQEMHPIYTIEELGSKSYAPNVMTACKYYEQAQTDEKIPYLSDYNDEESFWTELHLHQEKNSSSKTIQDFLDSYEHLSTVPYSSLQDKYDKDLEHWPCKPILRISNGDTELYTVQIYQSPAYGNTQWTNDDLFRFVTDFPRDKITFLTRPYMSDVYLDGVFRHSIGIRDEMIPDAWKNIK